MKFYTTSSVRDSIEKYKKKDSYSKCCHDLCDFFAGKDIETISCQPKLLGASGKVHFQKSRFASSNTSKGKSNGYRIYYVVDKENNTVTLIGIFPKTGVFGIDDISNSQYKEIISEYKREKSQGALCRHNIAKAFVQEPAI
jgi:mRNA-degrading endonuclease RelE of RelBE toxin-antitoxin system